MGKALDLGLPSLAATSSRSKTSCGRWRHDVERRRRMAAYQSATMPEAVVPVCITLAARTGRTLPAWQFWNSTGLPRPPEPPRCCRSGPRTGARQFGKIGRIVRRNVGAIARRRHEGGRIIGESVHMVVLALKRQGCGVLAEILPDARKRQKIRRLYLGSINDPLPFVCARIRRAEDR